MKFSLEELQAKTNAELIELCGTEVMGLNCLHPLDDQDDVPGEPKRVCKRCGAVFRIRDWNAMKQWNPLSDWNHTMQLFERVKKLRPVPDELGDLATALLSGDQRAIVLAALLTVA